ncbi:DUF3179 domain-containing protein [Streptomyces regalis]|uniref:DUF3179 domain-containing protein n=1 Tax=Streptomyces regalis TaxID=68262 RepID=A0A0X3US75_9ACTN|nr:DUF3179 domain-containing protein [Streptomyces regalis]KUL35441.1 hypothetical protein ADL12_19820 [Streptomyces regalis]
MLKGAAVIGGLAVLVAGGGFYGVRRLTDDSGDGPASTAQPASPGEPTSLERLAAGVVPGGPGKDGIPAIDKPRFVDADDAPRFLSDDQPVFGLEGQGGERPRAYPQLVLVWHEIVNDRVGGRPLTVTYCPLTGTAIAFTGPPDGAGLTFGTTGNLVNSNLLMYDRQTDSTWPQITGTAITGKRKGQRLATTPLVWTTWKTWRTARPSTKVLSTDTGHLRDYGSDPYGSYTRDSGYYVEGGPIFPVLARDRSRRFADKDVVVGVRRGQRHLAVAKKRIEREGAVRAELGGAPMTVRWNRTLGAAHLAGAEGGTEAFDAMWFAWYAFHPDTQVLS